MSNKSLLVLYQGDDWEQQQPVLNFGLRETYMVWGNVAKKHKVTLHRASAKWFVNGRFTKYWRYLGKGEWDKVPSPLVPTIVYDKAGTHSVKTGERLPRLMQQKHEMLEHVEIVNLPYFSELVDNKLYQASIFHKFMPKSLLWQAGQVIDNPKKKRIVLKSLGGSGGAFVRITRKKRISIDHLQIEQKFIEATKKGVLQDIRLAFIGDKPQYVYSRVAEPGSLYTNVHKGAIMKWMKLKDIKPVIKIAQEITKSLSVFPKRVVSFDFLIDARKNKPFLVEANPRPGTNNFGEERLYAWFDALTTHIFSKPN